MARLQKIVDYHRNELYYDAVKAFEKSKRILKFHGHIRYMYRKHKFYFWYYWDCKYRIKVQDKLEERLNKYVTRQT